MPSFVNTATASTNVCEDTCNIDVTTDELLIGRVLAWTDH
jgi:hypothetical protein